jgi:hypothetical protein
VSAVRTRYLPVPSAQRGSNPRQIGDLWILATGPANIVGLEHFHHDWKRPSSYFASNFISLRLLRNASQADIALERFHHDWKRSSSYFASNFISLRLLRNASQADIALVGISALGRRR